MRRRERQFALNPASYAMPRICPRGSKRIGSRRSKPVVSIPNTPVFPHTSTSVALGLCARSLLRAATIRLPFSWPGLEAHGPLHDGSNTRLVLLPASTPVARPFRSWLRLLRSPPLDQENGGDSRNCQILSQGTENKRLVIPVIHRAVFFANESGESQANRRGQDHGGQGASGPSLFLHPAGRRILVKKIGKLLDDGAAQVFGVAQGHRVLVITGHVMAYANGDQFHR